MKDYTAAEAIARAWHPVGCLYKFQQYEDCKYQLQHEHTARNAIKRLAESGWRLVRDVPDEPQTVPMFGEDV